MARNDEDATAIQQTLLDLRNSVSLFEYRAFLKAVHFFVFQFLKARGSHEYRMCLNKGDARYLTMTFQTEKADYLLRLLGFVDVPENSDLMAVADYEWSCPKLEIFCDMAAQELIVSKGDSLALQSLSQSAHRSVAVVYMAYHLHIQIQLLFRATDDHLLSSVELHILKSLEAVETVACNLGIMEQGGTVRAHWDCTKSKIMQYLQTPSGKRDKQNICFDIRLLCRMMKHELKAITSRAVYSLLPHLQNMQALLLVTNDERMMSQDHMQMFISNCVEVPHELFSDEYAHSLEELLSLMQKGLVQALSVTDIEQAHRITTWQSENVFSHLNKSSEQLGYAAREKPSFVHLPSLCGRAPSDVENRKGILREILDLLKSVVSYRKYRQFLDVVHVGVQHLLHTQGAEPFQCINKAETRFAAVVSETEVAINLMYLLGYKEVPMVDDSLVMDDYFSAEPMLIAFSELGYEELVVSKGDPLMTRSVIDIDHLPTLVAYLSYHFWLRCHLLVIHSVEHLLPNQEQEILTSTTIIDSVTSRLGILTSSSPACSQWGSTKQRMMRYLTCLNRQGERRIIHDSLCEVGNQLIIELGQMLPMDVVRLMFYAQSVETLLGFTAAGDMLNDSVISQYLTCSSRLGLSSFSDEYMKVNEDVRGTLVASFCRPWNDEEFDKLHSLSRWQSENFLSHLNPTALDVNDSRPALLSMMSEAHSDVVDYTGDQLATECQPSATVGEVAPSVDPGEEKADVSEKLIDREKGCLELESETEGFQQDNICEVADSVMKQTVCSESQDKFDRDSRKDTSLGCFLLELSNTKHVRLSVLLPLVSGLKRPDEISLAGNRVAVLVKELTAQIDILENEICDIEAALSETAPDLVVQTLHSALPGRQQDLAILTKNLTELQEIKKALDGRHSTSKCAGLMELDVADLRDLLKGFLVCRQHQSEILGQLMGCVVDLYLVTDDELQQLCSAQCSLSW